MAEKAGFANAFYPALHTLRWYVLQMGQQFLTHDCWARAGALTYTTLFAVVPMMTVAYAMFSLIPAFEGVGERVQEFIFNNFVPNSSAVVQEKLIEFSERARGLTWLGFIFLFATSFLLLVTIEKTFNTLWHVAEPRRGLQRFLLYWGVLSLGPLSLCGGILISIYLFSLPLVSDLEVFGVGTLLLGYLPVLLTWAAFTVLYYAVPNCHVPLKHALLGGVLTMLSFEVAKKLFNIAVSNTSIAPIYGTFAAVPFFLVWMFMVWVLILGGAIFVRTLSLTPEDEAEQTEPLLIKCSRVLEILRASHHEGRSLTDVEINSQVRMTRAEHEKVFEVLQDLRLLTVVEDDRWLLGRSLKSVTLWDLYQKLPDGLDLERLAAVKGMAHVVDPLKSLVEFGSNQMTMSLESVFGGA